MDRSQINLYYEYILRFAHGVERYGVPECTTDIYDGLNLSDKSFEMGERLGKIKTALRYAIHKLVNDHRNVFSDSDIEKLEEIADEGLFNVATNNDMNDIIVALHDYAKKVRI